MTTGGTKTKTAEPGEVVLDRRKISEELGLVAPEQAAVTAEADPELDQQADEVVAALLSVAADDVAGMERSKATVENLGLDLQQKASRQSDKLKEPIKKISHRSEDGGEVANSLVDLRIQVEELDPARFDFDPGWFTRFLGYIPGMGTPLKRYFSKYETAQTVINAIISSLEGGREQLKRDNITLGEDQKQMRELTIKLIKAIKLSQLIDQKLQSKLDNELPTDDPQYKFISEELLFPLRQRVLDLQQQLAVTQQGILAMEIVIRNNKELIRGVNRALNVTVNALQVAVTVALALTDQKIVLEKVQALNETTSDLITSTAARLKTQGAEIHKLASTSQLDIESLKQAFADIREAMEDISKFRTQALPQMAESIKEMDLLTKEAEETIEQKQRGRKQAEPLIPIEIN